MYKMQTDYRATRSSVPSRSLSDINNLQKIPRKIPFPKKDEVDLDPVRVKKNHEKIPERQKAISFHLFIHSFNLKISF